MIQLPFVASSLGRSRQQDFGKLWINRQPRAATRTGNLKTAARIILFAFRHSEHPVTSRMQRRTVAAFKARPQTGSERQTDVKIGVAAAATAVIAPEALKTSYAA